MKLRGVFTFLLNVTWGDENPWFPGAPVSMSNRFVSPVWKMAVYLIPNSALQAHILSVHQDVAPWAVSCGFNVGGSVSIQA